jgi:hypothetical protein
LRAQKEAAHPLRLHPYPLEYSLVSAVADPYFVHALLVVFLCSTRLLH